MQLPEILQQVPASVNWLVAFDLPSLAASANPDSIKRMFGLSPVSELDCLSHVILTSEGNLLAPMSGAVLTMPDSLRASNHQQDSAWERFADLLELCPLHEAECLGLGENGPWSPILVWMSVESTTAQATAIFDREPPRRGYDLLRAIGVQYDGGYAKGNKYLAHFSNRIPVHVLVGDSSGFSRTSHCTRFFLQHGQIDERLEHGLLQASEARVEVGRSRLLVKALEFTRRAGQGELCLTCQPPSPDAPFPFGNLAPWGLLLAALTGSELDEEECSVRDSLRGFIIREQQQDLWSYHSGGLVTATDTVLVLQGIDSIAAVNALERFHDKKGGYFPQLWSADRDDGRMQQTERNRHWCQPDFLTACLVRSYRRAYHLPISTSFEFLERHFSARSSLFVANPYIIDWALAAAIGEDEEAGPLRKRLAREILAGRNEDCSFGQFDVPLSTAFAALALARLGYRDRSLLRTQVRLTDLFEDETVGAGAKPFYSSLQETSRQIRTASDLRKVLRESYEPGQQYSSQRLTSAGRHYGVSFYVDADGALTLAAGLQALSVECSAERDHDVELAAGPLESRYRCASALEYVTRFALPPYLVMDGD